MLTEFFPVEPPFFAGAEMLTFFLSTSMLTFSRRALISAGIDGAFIGADGGGRCTGGGAGRLIFTGDLMELGARGGGGGGIMLLIKF